MKTMGVVSIMRHLREPVTRDVQQRPDAVHQLADDASGPGRWPAVHTKNSRKSGDAIHPETARAASMHGAGRASAARGGAPAAALRDKAEPAGGGSSVQSQQEVRAVQRDRQRRELAPCRAPSDVSQTHIVRQAQIAGSR